MADPENSIGHASGGNSQDSYYLNLNPDGFTGGRRYKISPESSSSYLMLAVKALGFVELKT